MRNQGGHITGKVLVGYILLVALAVCSVGYIYNIVKTIVEEDVSPDSRSREKVYLIHRRDQLRATAVYHQRLADLPNVEFVWNSTVTSLSANEMGALAAATVRDKVTGEERVLEVSGLFVAVGTLPNTEFLQGALDVDEAGYILTDENGATSAAGVWAAGDVRRKALRQVVTAVSDGAVCAEQAAEHLSL